MADQLSVVLPPATLTEVTSRVWLNLPVESVNTIRVTPLGGRTVLDRSTPSRSMLV